MAGDPGQPQRINRDLSTLRALRQKDWRKQSHWEVAVRYVEIQKQEETKLCGLEGQ